MHNISKQSVQDVAAEIVELCLTADSEKILEKVRELYEMSVLLHHKDANTKTDVEQEQNVIPETPETETHTFEKIEETELSVEERIKLIMEQAPKLPEQDMLFFPDLEDKSVEEIIKSPDPILESKKVMPQINQDEEMKTSVPADIAADMFEKVNKTDTPKKSLNDRLSQEQIQIGLNDRIAFVKHLFEDNLADFNRVLSQLNSFETEQEAKDFLNNIVKADYNWTEKTEYEQRFIQLIERKFL